MCIYIYITYMLISWPRVLVMAYCSNVETSEEPTCTSEGPTACLRCLATLKKRKQREGATEEVKTEEKLRGRDRKQWYLWELNERQDNPVYVSIIARITRWQVTKFSLLSCQYTCKCQIQIYHLCDENHTFLNNWLHLQYSLVRVRHSCTYMYVFLVMNYVQQCSS